MLSKKSLAYSLIAIIMTSSFVIAGCSSKSANAQSDIGTVQETTVSNTVESSGTVEALQMETLTWQTSGTILKINNSAGDSVTKGDVLMELDPSTAPSSIILAQSDLTAAKEDLENLIQSHTTTAEAQLALANAQVAYNNALGAGYSTSSPRGTAEQIAYYQAQLAIANARIDELQKIYDRYAEASDTDKAKAQALSNLMAAKLDQKNIQMYLNYYQTAQNSNESAVTEAEIAVAKAALEDAQRAYDLVKNGPTADEIAAAQAKVDAAQATVNELKIIAPFSGTLAFLNNEVGDMVNTGTEAAILVNRSKLFVDVLIDETQIAKVKVGDPATITFSAINNFSTTGKVTAVNPIGTSNSGVVNYTVRVTLDKDDPKILLGATANVVIQVSEAQKELTVPVSAVQNDAQGEYVIRINNGSSERVNVVSGKIINDTVVVTGDLKAGDKVQLTTSSSTTSSTTTSSSSNRQNGGGPGGNGIFMP